MRVRKRLASEACEDVSEASPAAGRRARVEQRAIRGKMDFFPELDRVQLFRPDFDLLGACSHEEAKPPESV